VRIRSGSPGSRQQGNCSPLIQATSSFNNDEEQKLNSDRKKKLFQAEMKDRGLHEDVEEVGRFNYVLLSRSQEFENGIGGGGEESKEVHKSGVQKSKKQGQNQILPAASRNDAKKF
jgi:hypothetical protein